MDEGIDGIINGARLADLMIEHNIGVSTVRTIELKRLDSGYFEVKALTARADLPQRPES